MWTLAGTISFVQGASGAGTCCMVPRVYVTLKIPTSTSLAFSEISCPLAQK